MNRLLDLTPNRRALLRTRLEREGVSGATEPGIAPADRSGPLPLSPSQEHLWFIEQLLPESGLYNVAFRWHLAGPLDVATLAASLASMVRRHEILRTCIEARDGDPPVHVLRPAGTIRLPLVVLDGLPAAARQTASGDLVGCLARRPFDLTAGPLYRFLLVALGRDRFALLLLFHHLIIDRGSIAVFCRELAETYQALCHGRHLPPAPRLQYADFAVWQRRRLAAGGETCRKGIEFWRRQLAGCPQELEIPLDRPRPARPAFRLGSVPCDLPAAVAEAVRSQALTHGASPFMTVLAGFGAWLHRLTGMEDILVGTPVSHRGRTELRDVVGFFANLLVLRIDAAGAPTWRELVERTRQTALAAYAHQDLPFELLVRELQPRRHADRNPLCQVSFSLDPADDLADTPFPALRSRLEVVEVSPFQFDLILALQEGPEGLQGVLRFQREVLDTHTVLRWCRQFQVLLAEAVADPARKLSELPLLAAPERHQLLVEWNDSAADLPCERLVHELVESQAAVRPDAVALAEAGGALSYGELWRRARRLSDRLLSMGVTGERRVGILLERCPETVIAMLGTLCAGGAFVPVDPKYPRERIAFLLRDAGMTVLLTAARWRTLVPASGVPVLDVEAAAGEAAGIQMARVGPRQLAYAIYTSGSTGNPKGVEVEHASLLNMSLWHACHYGVGPADRKTHLASPSFDASAAEIWPHLIAGACLCLPPEETVASASDVLAYLAAERITLCCLPTPLAEAVFAEPWPGGMALRSLQTGGEALRRRPPAALDVPLTNHYGPTENTVDATVGGVAPVGGDARLPGIGRPLAGVRAHVVDRCLEPTPIGTPGELLLGGAGLARGYLARPDLTAERFLPDPFGAAGGRLYRTGDLVRHRSDGDLEFIGRLDRQVKIRGFRIEPGEVQAALAALPEVRESFVTARPDHRGDLQLTAYLVFRPGAVLPAEALRARLSRLLPRYMIPSAWVVQQALPLTLHRKVDADALPAPRLLRQELQAPRTALEEILAGIWERVLGVEQVAPGDNFFELGGHSLLATRIVADVGHTLGVKLSLRHFFEHPTLADQARCAAQLRGASLGAAEAPLTRAPRTGGLPLSSAQLRLWFFGELSGARSLFNLPLACRVRGPFDVAVFGASLRAVLLRHEVLRAAIVADGGEPEHRPGGLPDPAPVGTVDLSGVPAARRLATLRALLDEEAWRPFPPGCGQHLRGLIVRLGEGEHALLLTTHHLVFDDGSTAILFRELAAFYEALLARRPAQLPDLPVQYLDFAVWQRRQLDRERKERLLGYWRAQLNGVPQLLQLPADRARPPVQSHRGGHVPFVLDAGLADALRELGRREGKTLFMILFAALSALLCRITGARDLLLGSPASHRSRPELEHLIGCFVNNLVLRARIARGLRFLEVLAAARETVLGAHDHQDLPFEMLVEDLQPERDLSRSPLFQVMLALQSTAATDLRLTGVEVEPLDLGGRFCQFDLALSVTDRRPGLSGFWSYSSDLFEATSLQRLSQQFEALLAATVADPLLPVDDLPWIPVAERQQLLVEWNDTRIPPAQAGAVHQLFAAQARRFPDAPAVIFRGRSWTYRQLARQAAWIARRLRGMGAGPETLVGVFLERTPDMVAALLGILEAGAAYVPLDPSYPAERLSFMIQDAGVTAVLTQQALAGRLPERSGRPLVLDQDPLPVEDGADRDEGDQSTDGGAGRQNLAYVIYTSGSTGRPKGVMVPHGAVLNFFAAMDLELGTAPGVWLAITSISFDISVLEILWTTSRGSTLALVEESAAREEPPAALLSRHGVTHLQCTPTWAEMVLAHEGSNRSLRPLQRLLLGGEALPAPLARRLRQGLSGSLVNLYGPTETTVWSARWRAEGEIGGSCPIGRPLANNRLYLLDPSLQPVALGHTGEIFLGGAGVVRGYHGQAALTAERFLPDPFGGEAGARLYRTGDLARYLPDGRVEFLGRRDQQVKIRGHRVELGEIEARLDEHPGVRKAAVALRRDGSGDPQLIAYVVPLAGAGGDTGTPAAQELRDHLRRRLPAHMVPAHYVPLAALPLTPNGKVNRAALPDPGAARLPEPPREDLVPSQGLEPEIAALWRQLLRTDRIGPRDNFFEQGGTSLMLVRLRAGLQQELGHEVTLADLFRHTTVESLARFLESRDRDSGLAVDEVQERVGRQKLARASRRQRKGRALEVRR